MLNGHSQILQSRFELEAGLAFGFSSLLLVDLLELVHSHIHRPLVGLFVLVAHLFVFNLVDESLYSVLSDFSEV